MKTVYLIFALFISMLNSYANADDTGARPLTENEKLEISWAHLQDPLGAIFDKNDTYIDMFLTKLMNDCGRDEVKNVIIASMADIGKVCMITFADINPKLSKEEVREKFNDICVVFSFEVAANVLGEATENVRTAFYDNKEDADDIYEISSVSTIESIAYKEFSRRLQQFIVKKYCVSQSGSVGCFPPVLECEKVERTKYLERDLKLYCKRGNWETMYNENDGTYEVRLKR